jgi:hypothetical protein
MKVSAIAFPFSQTFRRLELEKRWWHRLCLVVFFVLLVGTTAFIAWVAYAVSAPQVSTIPDIQVGDIFDQVAAEQQQNDPYVPYGGHSVAPPVPPGFVPLSNQQQATVDYDALAKKFGGVAVQSMIDQQHVVHQIPMDKVIDALEAGDQRVVDMYDPKGNGGWIPEDKVREAIAAGFTIAKPVTLDKSSFKPLDKTIQMPDGSIETFAGTVTNDAIKAQWNHAKNHQIRIAMMWTGLFAIVGALFVLFSLQGAYRVLLYIIFGSAMRT